MAIRVEISTDRNERPCATAWRGKQARPYASHWFRSEERRDEWVGEQHANEQATADRKAAAKLERTARTVTMRLRLQVGAILVNSWGYDQTNVDAYEVISRSASGATIKVREIITARVADSEGFMSAQVVPCPGHFAEGSEPVTKKVTEYGISIRHGGSATPHEKGRSYYSSWYA